jgi:hypothetical protein
LDFGLSDAGQFFLFADETVSNTIPREAHMGTPFAISAQRDNVSPNARIGPAGCERCAQFWNSRARF